MLRFVLICYIAFFTSFHAHAVNPDEVLENPVLEERARSLSTGLRCLVCQNQSIDDSDAQLARDLRLLVREKLTEGYTDREVLDYLVARYGEFVLLKPRFTTRNLALWAAPVILLGFGGLGIALMVRRRRELPVSNGLSTAEKADLEKILK